jgi:hypothetical protein
MICKDMSVSFAGARDFSNANKAFEKVRSLSVRLEVLCDMSLMVAKQKGAKEDALEMVEKIVIDSMASLPSHVFKPDLVSKKNINC